MFPNIRCSYVLPAATLLFLLFSYPKIARTQNFSNSITLPFESLTIDDGLSQGMVNCITQDHYGFMWFGTKDGLNRYDGIRFTVYKNDPSDSTSLRDNYIQYVYEDKQNLFWVGTSREGLEYFNRETETFTHIRLNEDPRSRSNCIINIQEDADGNLWVGTMGGLFKISFQSINGIKNINSFRVKKFFDNSCGFCISKEGLIYGSAANLYPFRIRPDNNNKDIVDTLEKSKFYWIPEIISDRLILTGSVSEDPTTGKIYFYYEYCITEFDPVSQISKFLLKRPAGTGELPVNAIYDNNNIYIATSNKLLQIKKSTFTINSITTSDYNLKTASEQIRYVYRCRSGIFWLGTMGYGILRFNPKLLKFNTTSLPSISYLTTNNAGEIISLDRTSLFNIYNADSGRYLSKTSDNFVFKSVGTPSSLSTKSIVQDKFGNYWLCRHYLMKYNPNSGVITKYGDNYVDGPVLHFDSKDNLWYGTRYGFTKFNILTEKCEEWKYPFQVSNDPYFFLQSLAEDSSGNFWLGTNNGLIKFNPITHEWKLYKHNPSDNHSLSSNLIFCLFTDQVYPDSILWIGTSGGGLNRFNKISGTFTRYSESDGLPNNVIYGILNDEKNNLWLSTNRGLSKCKPELNKYKNYDVHDGLQSNEFNRNAYCRDSSGRLYFGGVSGINSFYPSEISDNNIIPTVVITGIKIKNKPVNFKSKEAPIKRPAYLEKQLTVVYEDNMISFEFAALEMSAPQKNEYKYKLSGFDKEWIEAGTNHSAIYTNLDPGNYVFHVTGSNNDGLWSDSETTINLTILPPWYMTWWFRLLAIGSFILAVNLIYSYRMNEALKIQKLRNRIASDLHDEIGSTLSSISLYGVSANKLLDNNPEAKKLISRINDNTTQMMEAMSDIIWSINTKTDRFEDLINKIRAIAGELAEAKQFRLVFDDEDGFEKITFSMIERKNIFLIFKEAINNAVKYSACEELYIGIKHHKSGFRLIIRDNGIGFDPDEIERGNGLTNMEQRARDINALFSLKSSKLSGTEVILTYGK